MKTLADSMMFHGQEDRIEENTESHQSIEDGAGHQLAEKQLGLLKPVLLLPGLGEDDVVPGPGNGVLLATAGHPAVAASLAPTLTATSFLTGEF